jgi:hypothetical protein
VGSRQTNVDDPRSDVLVYCFAEERSKNDDDNDDNNNDEDRGKTLYFTEVYHDVEAMSGHLSAAEGEAYSMAGWHINCVVEVFL